ncbi:hypothetical protein J7E97_33835 [Streptomyces sp. ISL-66]|nr:hypothetical protein [Streptomyces sp. ISL-66]
MTLWPGSSPGAPRPRRACPGTGCAVALYDGHHARIGGLGLTSRAVSHGVPAFALRAESGGASLVYSGDTAPCPALTRFAEDCSLLLCEADSAAHPAGAEPVHHTPEEAGDTASAARARRLVVTHVGRDLAPAEAVSRAAARYHGPVDHAAPGAVFAIG